MSDIQGRRNEDFAKYDTMPTEDLQEILRQDANAPEGVDSDIELLLYVMEVLADRRRNSENPGTTALEAYESFQKNYLYEDDVEEGSPDLNDNKPKILPFSWFRRLSIAAAILIVVFLGSVTANAFGFWEVVAQWTKETFHFSVNGQSNINDPHSNDALAYDSLDAALATVNIPNSIIPSYIPEKFILSHITVDETPLKKVVVAFYSNEDKQIRIHIQSYIEIDPEQIERSEVIETRTASDVICYIYSNHEQIQASWIIDSSECYISGDITIEEIRAMIDSIGKD